jgi:hypothetical protein
MSRAIRYPAAERSRAARAERAEQHAASPLSWDERTLWPTPLRPSAEWFERPTWLAPAQRLTVTDQDQVAGYFYSTGSSMRRSDGGTFEPQPSPTKYKLAHTGTVETDDGSVVQVAILGAHGHADVNIDAATAMMHYADPSRARAHVRLGDDEHGGWFSGAICPGVTVADVAAMRRFSVSGDWRWRSGQELARLGAVEANGGYDMIGLGVVLTPGLRPLAFVEDERPSQVAAAPPAVAETELREAPAPADAEAEFKAGQVQLERIAAARRHVDGIELGLGALARALITQHAASEELDPWQWIGAAKSTARHLGELREVLDSAEAAAVQAQLAVLDRQMADR